ncbi:MAG: hypothetical protein WD066_06785 [Planctomycetaceae bacterium]
MTTPRHSRMSRLACSALEGTIAGIARSLNAPPSAALNGHDAAAGRSDQALERCGAVGLESARFTERCGSAVDTLDAENARCGSYDARCGSHEQRCGAQLGDDAWRTAEERMVRVC